VGTEHHAYAAGDDRDRAALAYGWDAQGRGIGGGEATVTLTEENGQTLLVQHFRGDISDDMLPMMEQGTDEQLDKLGALLASAA
jgi:hypothetical protein